MPKCAQKESALVVSTIFLFQLGLDRILATYILNGMMESPNEFNENETWQNGTNTVTLQSIKLQCDMCYEKI